MLWMGPVQPSGPATQLLHLLAVAVAAVEVLQVSKRASQE
jgi:hypothetical protein